MACARLANANSSANVNTKNKPSWRVYFFRYHLYGGDDEIQTHDLCNANAALYQLSYVPITNIISYFVF